MQKSVGVEFCPSIGEDLLFKAIAWARTMCEISDEEVEAIKVAKKSILCHQGSPWGKKGKPFDVGIGSYDGAECGEKNDTSTHG